MIKAGRVPRLTPSLTRSQRAVLVPDCGIADRDVPFKVLARVTFVEVVTIGRDAEGTRLARDAARANSAIMRDSLILHSQSL